MPEAHAKRRWLPFDHLIDDASLAELISPVVAALITRRDGRAFFEYYGDELDLGRFRDREHEWLARWHEENDPRLEAEREARFQAYLFTQRKRHSIFRSNASVWVSDALKLPVKNRA